MGGRWRGIFLAWQREVARWQRRGGAAAPFLFFLPARARFSGREGGRHGAGREGGRDGGSPEATRKDTATAEIISRPMLRTSLCEMLEMIASGSHRDPHTVNQILDPSLCAGGGEFQPEQSRSNRAGRKGIDQGKGKLCDRRTGPGYSGGECWTALTRTFVLPMPGAQFVKTWVIESAEAGPSSHV